MIAYTCCHCRRTGAPTATRVLESLQAAACIYRIAYGPRAGQKVLTLRGAAPSAADFKQHLCANLEVFSQHAAVCCAAHEHKTLERLCRYIARPPICNEQVRCNATGVRAVSAARVLRPRLHLIRFGVRITSLREVSVPPLREHGVRAPNSKLREQGVPNLPNESTLASYPQDGEAHGANGRVRPTWGRLLKRVFNCDITCKQVCLR